uniref:Endo-beta-1,2-glucanase SGL domain-containing protein n=1 Tax=Plectus sambesii TaxID=2011161 RepID=A0A914UV20_9BILA
MMAKNGLTVFYDGPGSGNIRCVSMIKNVAAMPTSDNYYRTPGDDCNLDDPYEGETFTFFVDLYSDWSPYPASDRDLLWVNKRTKLQAVNFNSLVGPITVERGWWHSSHEKWKFMELPYFDVPLMNSVFLNGERARTHFSMMHSYPGLFAAVTNVSEPGDYTPGYISAVGIQEIAFQK